MAKIVNFDENAKNSSVSSVEIFENSEFGKVRALVIDGSPWFVGNDIASILGYKIPKDAVKTHVLEKDKIVVQLSDIQEGGDTPLPDNMKGSKITIINESGLYRLILRSNMPNAEMFTEWVTSDVLPSIRKYGSYFLDNERHSMSDKEYELRILEARNRSAEILMSISDKTSIPEYKSVLNHYIFKTITGDSTSIPLPAAVRKTYSAGEIGSMLGVSGNKIGRLANEHNLKTSEYGKLFYDKSRYSNKEVETFRYYENAISVFKTILDSNSIHK